MMWECARGLLFILVSFFIGGDGIRLKSPRMNQMCLVLNFSFQYCRELKMSDSSYALIYFPSLSSCVK